VLAAAHRLIIGKIIRGAPIKDVERRAVVMALISQWLPKAEQRRIERALRLKRVEAHLLINAMMPVVSRTTIAETYGFASVEAMDKWRTRQKDRTKTR
jgi:hypothetical protein